MQEFQHKKWSADLAMGMVACSQVLEQLGHWVKLDELTSKMEAREQAESSWRRLLESAVGILEPIPST